MSEEMTPPSKGKDTKATKAKAKPAGDGEKKPRKARKDWGYSKNSVISVTAPKEEPKYSGLRADVYKLVLKADGKTVAQFAEKFDVQSKKGVSQSAASWLSFFNDEGIVTLTKPEPEEKAA